MKVGIWVLVLVALAGAGAWHFLASDDTTAPQSPTELTRRAYDALIANDVEAFQALGPTEEDLEFLLEQIEERGTSREVRRAREEVQSSGGIKGMHAKHQDSMARSFREAREILATECHLPIARFFGVEPHTTKLEDQWGIEGGNIHFRVSAGTIEVSIRLAACAHLERGWVCGKAIFVLDLFSHTRDRHSTCSASPTGASLEALREIASTLDGPDFPWLSAAMAPLVRIRDKIREDPAQAVKLPLEDVRARVRDADVIVVSDQHDLVACQKAFARILNELGPMVRTQKPNMIVGLEMISDDRFEAARPLFTSPLTGDGEDIGALMRKCTAWPIGGYVNIAESVYSAGASLIPVGMRLAPTQGMPSEDTPDAERRPGIVPVQDPTEPRREFFERNRRVADTVAAALKKDPESIAILFYGGAHLLDHEPGFGNLHGLFLERGLKPLILVSFLRDWELAIREGKQRSDWSWWHEVAPGVLRTDCVTDAEILEMARKQNQK